MRRRDEIILNSSGASKEINGDNTDNKQRITRREPTRVLGTGPVGTSPAKVTAGTTVYHVTQPRLLRAYIKTLIGTPSNSLLDNQYQINKAK